MTKGFAALIALCAVCMCLTACGNKGQDSSTAESAAETETFAAQTETMEATAHKTDAEKQPVADPNQDDPHIFDEIGLLSAQEVGELSAAAEKLSAEQQLHAAVVLTDDLGGASPDAFAAEYYASLFGRGSTGFLVLINNDTNEDSVYASGACSLYLTQREITLAIAQATPYLVEGKYRPAVERLLELGDLMPDLVYDRAGILSREQFDGFLAAAQAASEAAKKQYSVLLVEDAELGKAEDSLQKYTDAQRELLQADGLLVVDVHQEKCSVSGVPDAEALGAELTGILQNTQRLPVTAAVNAYYDKVKE